MKHLPFPRSLIPGYTWDPKLAYQFSILFIGLCCSAMMSIRFQPLDILTEHLEIEGDEGEQIGLGKRTSQICNEEWIFRCLVVTPG